MTLRVPLRVAFVPGAPLLFPELTGPGAVGAGPVRLACARVVRDLLDPRPPVVVVVAPGERTRRHPDGAWGTLAGFGVALEAPAPRAAGGPPRPPRPSLPPGLTVGCRLLDAAGWDGPLVLQEVASGSTPAHCRELGAALAAEVPAAAWLVVADGTTRRTARAPGSFDPRAEAFDAAAEEALATGSAAALARLDPTLAAELGAAGRAAWQVLAGAVPEGAGPQASGARVSYAGAPYGVGYLVAAWS